MTVDQSAQTAVGGDSNAGVAATTATVLTAVERQMSRYFTAISSRVDATLAEAEQLRTQALDELESQRAATEAHQHAVLRSLEARISEAAVLYTSQLGELELRLAKIAAQPVGVTPEDLLHIRDSMGEEIRRALAPMAERLDALGDANRRTDERTTALVQQLNASTAALVARIDDGDQRVGAELNSRFLETRDVIGARVDGLESATADLAGATEHRIDQLESRTQTSLASARATIDARISDLQSASDVRLAELETATSAIAAEASALGDCVSDGLASARSRLDDLGGALSRATLELATLAIKIGSIDDAAIEELKSQMSGAVGESMLVRIELERVHAMMDEKFDKTTVRLGEIEALLTDEMDVGAAVQLDRLDELERAVLLLDPDQFVKKDGSSAGSASRGDIPNHIGSDGSDGGQVPNGNNVHARMQEQTCARTSDSPQAEVHSNDTLSASDASSSRTFMKDDS